MSRDVAFERKILTEDGLNEAAVRVQEELYGAHGNLNELDRLVVIQAALKEGFWLAGGDKQIHKGSLGDLDAVDDHGVGIVYVYDPTAHLEDDETEVEGSEFIEPTDDELFGDSDEKLEVDLADPWDTQSRKEMQEKVDQGY